MLEPRLTDVNELFSGMEPLLRRTLDERIDIAFKRGEGLWRTRIDPGQLETAILNLAVNARDAMPEGGRLTIESDNIELDDNYALLNPDVTPGKYVLVAVEDSGCGMTPEVSARVFEPFFTTKEVGKGTGLGLSMVYGFVKQSGGHVRIYSEVGHGTVIKLFLPRAEEDAAATDASRSENDALLPTGTETILVVEDDALVRANTQTQLRTLGYRVTVAENAAAALALVDEGFVPDMLLTDIVMPGGMNGRELADELRRILPGLKVLYTSGYAHGATSEQLSSNGAHFIGKPFRRRTLAHKVREVLDGGAGRAREKGAA
jgi:CheY-like chemotaxis protein